MNENLVGLTRAQRKAALVALALATQNGVVNKETSSTSSTNPDTTGPTGPTGPIMDTSETGRSLPIAKESSELPSNYLTGKISSILTSPASPTTLLQAAQSQSPTGHQPTPHNRESPASAHTASPSSTFIPPSLESLLGATPIPKHTLQVNGTDDKNLIPEPVEQTTEMVPDHGKKITPEDKTLEITT